jgi:hypothetical protein
MAKGKHTRALFEVINKGNGDLQTPAWWFKGRPGAGEQRTASMAPMPLASGRFSYAIAAVAGAVIVLLAAIVFMLARSRGPSLSQNTDDLMRGPAQPAVMDIKRGEAGLTPAPAVEVSSPPRVPIATDGKRTAGLNYVVVQSYPDDKSALEAQEVLAKAGIPTTIEKGLRGWTQSWFMVVGLQGFTKIKSPEYETYVQKIEKADTYAKKKSFKAFHPIPFKWG